MYEETDYPRGGSRPPPNKIAFHIEDRQENLFGLNKRRKPPMKKRGKKLKSRDASDEIVYESTSAEVLSFKTVREGMLVLGCIKDISSLTLTVELPGLIFCELRINCISEAFTRRLSERLETDAIDEDTELRTLNEIFERGQLIPTRVIRVGITGKETEVFLSTKPSDVNATRRPSDFGKGTLVWAAVTEKSDHGYVLDVGVRHVRSILPFKHVEDGKEYVVGAPLWCVVKSGTSSNQAATLTLSALRDDVDASVQKEVPQVVEKVLPGTCVRFRAEKSLKDGLEGTIFTDSVAYVNEVHLPEPLESVKKYVGETLPALVLYVQPTTGFTFLTLRATRTEKQPNISLGQILPAQVISRTAKGVFVKLSKKERGFVSRHRLRKSLQHPLTAPSDFDALIEAKYPEGGTHDCRILDYAFVDGLYVCTFERGVLDEKIFTVSDLTVGEIVKATVQEINRSGIVVKVGNVKGFVTNEHLSNARYNELFKTKFKKGQTVTGRVWLNKGLSNVKLTLKTAFVESDVCLKDYEEARVNCRYPGMLVKITGSGGALVKFYNDVQGWLKQPPDSRYNFKQFFYEGQVISAWVADKDGTRLTLSLEGPNDGALKPEEDETEEIPKGDAPQENGISNSDEEANGQGDTSEDDAEEEEEENQIDDGEQSDDERGDDVDDEDEKEEDFVTDGQEERNSSGVDVDDDDEVDDIDDEEKEDFNADGQEEKNSTRIDLVVVEEDGNGDVLDEGRDDENEDEDGSTCLSDVEEVDVKSPETPERIEDRKRKRPDKKRREEIENGEPHFLVLGDEDGDAPDFEEARRLKIKTTCAEALRRLKPVNMKKKKEKRTPNEVRRIKRRKALQRTLKKIEVEEAVLYDESYKCNAKSSRAVLPGVQHFFEESDGEDDVAGPSSSDDEDAESGESASNKGKKRKLSRRERADLLREQEEYLRNKEEELISTGGIPQNAEQFDRRLLGEPNSSELWAQYVAFHIQSTEIEKARAVVRRALKTIQQSAVQDRLNIWITYLNLEGMYGTKETFDEVFGEAVRCNDALTIYLEAIKILADSSSSADGLDEKIRKARGKFKQEAKMYVEIGRIYYKQKKLADARKLKDNALRTIADKKKHVPLIVQFAIMEFNDGEENHAEALFETILQSDPRRTDVWGAYVDQLVKKNKIDSARRVLQRAAGQKLNYKKMKVLYKKFQEFEQMYGTSETQEHVRRLLEEYASQFVDASFTIKK